MSDTDRTATTKAIAARLEQAVLERVAAAIENEMPMMRTEVVQMGTYDRMHRVSHPTYLDEPVYLRVTAHAISATEARRMFPGGDGNRDALPVNTSPQDPESAWANPPTPHEA